MELPHGNSYWIEPARLMAGEYPGGKTPDQAAARLEAHLRCGIDSFLDLTDPLDRLLPYAPILREVAPHCEYRRMTIRDMDIPDHAWMGEILDELEAALERGRCVYVHCWGGIGRTGTVVGCHLVEQRSLSGQAALDQLALWWAGVEKVKRFPRSPQTDAQCQFVRDWKSRRSS